MKLEHSIKVLDNARSITRAAGYGDSLTRACLLAGIYHDLGRFAQYRLYQTFKDKNSCNHAALGAAMLQRHKLLVNEPGLCTTVIRAVALHNAWMLPDGLAEDTALVAGVIRDADKLDILRVMDEHLSRSGAYEPAVILSLPDDPELHSEAVIRMTLEGRAASYADLKSLNDFRLLLGSWVNALHTPEARRLIVIQGHAASLVRALPDTWYGKARDCLLRALM